MEGLESKVHLGFKHQGELLKHPTINIRPLFTPVLDGEAARWRWAGRAGLARAAGQLIQGQDTKILHFSLCLDFLAGSPVPWV